MPICKLCDGKFPSWKKINNKRRNLTNRKYCLECSPFDYHNTQQLNKPIKTNKLQKKCKSVYDNAECICDKCNRKYVYQKSKGHTLSLCNSCVVSKSRGNLKEKAVEYKGGKCEKCGYDKCIVALCFHHIDSSKKDFMISRGHLFGWVKTKQELDKCVLLCLNCHAEAHYDEHKKMPV